MPSFFGHRNQPSFRIVILNMLLLKRDRSFAEVLNGVASPVVIIPAVSVNSADAIAVAARTHGFGVTIIEGRWAGESAQQLFVILVGNESQLLGAARRTIHETDSAANWFLLRRPGFYLLVEDANRSRELCVLLDDRFTLPNGRTFQFGAAYTSASFNKHC